MIQWRSKRLHEVGHAWRTWSIAALLLAGLLLSPKTSFAFTSCTGTVTVTASTTNMSFGSYDVLNATSTAGTGTITVSANCRHGGGGYVLVYAIALSTGSGGSFNPRAMSFGSAQLQYNLYTDANLSTIWGDGSAGTQTVPGTISATCNPGGNKCSGQLTSTVYGNIPAMQNVVAGNYNDNITVTVSF
jgi:spore coat protein U-like protein